MMRFGFCRGRPFGPGDEDFGDRGLRKVNFPRGGTSQPNSHRKTLTVDQYNPLRFLAALGFADCGAPLSPVRSCHPEGLSHLSSPHSSSVPSRVRQALSQAPFSCQCCNRRQQVEGDGNSSGRNRHAAPVCGTQSTPSKHARFGAGGRPAYRAAASAWEARAQSASTACPSTAYAASSWQKLNGPPASRVSA